MKKSHTRKKRGRPQIAARQPRKEINPNSAGGSLEVGQLLREEEEGVEGLPVLRTHVAGIDLGSEEHWVCAPRGDGSGRETVVFGATTLELEKMAAWLKERQIESVAMEGTGVYWIAPHEVLERYGFEVLLLNTRELARVPGRKKTDRVDARWIQKLHACGLLQGSFRPSEQVCLLRTYVRDRGVLVAEAADWVRRMQKSLDQMNVRVHRAVSDVDGVTGMAILRAIVQGERDPQQLAKLRDQRCKHTEQEIAEQLSGHWREDHLFSLAQALKVYDSLQERKGDYDRQILQQLEAMTAPERRDQPVPALPNQEKGKAIQRHGEEPLREALYRMSGVDLTTIDAIGVETVQVVLSEYGPDLKQFPNEDAFVSHINLAPRKPVTGGKPIKRGKKRGSASTRVSSAFRMAATSMRDSRTALGAYYRQVARRVGRDVAVFATARKLAQLTYRLLRWGQVYVDEGAEAYERRYRELRLQRLKASAKDIGYELTPVTV